MRILKLMSDVRQENGVLSLKCGKQQAGVVTNDVMFAYAHEKIKILLSVLSIFFSFFFMILI